MNARSAMLTWSVSRLSAALLVLPIASAGAQQGLRAAEGTTSILSSDFSAWTLDPKESSISLLIKSGRSTIRKGVLNNLQLTLAAEKGKRDVLSKGELTPGITVDERLATTWFDGTNGALVALYAGVAIDVSSNNLVDFDPVDSTKMQQYSRTARNWQGSVGLNWRPRGARESEMIRPTWSTTLKTSTFGLQLRTGYGSNLPLAKRAASSCSTAAQGTDSSGKTVVVANCQQRFLGRVHNATNGQLRLDVVTGRWRPVSTKAIENERSLRRDSTRIESERERLRRDIEVQENLSAELTQAIARVTQQLRVADEGDVVGILKDLAQRQAELAGQRVALTDGESQLANTTADRDRLAARLAKLIDSQYGVPSFALISAFSRDFERGLASAHNVAFGPALFAPKDGTRMLGAVLFELTDVKNARKESPRLKDRASVRLYIGVPF